MLMVEVGVTLPSGPNILLGYYQEHDNIQASEWINLMNEEDLAEGCVYALLYTLYCNISYPVLHPKM